jgi:hypothetical protein
MTICHGVNKGSQQAEEADMMASEDSAFHSTYETRAQDSMQHATNHTRSTREEWKKNLRRS